MGQKNKHYLESNYPFRPRAIGLLRLMAITDHIKPRCKREGGKKQTGESSIGGEELSCSSKLLFTFGKSCTHWKSLSTHWRSANIFELPRLQAMHSLASFLPLASVICRWAKGPWFIFLLQIMPKDLLKHIFPVLRIYLPKPLKPDPTSDKKMVYHQTKKRWSELCWTRISF